MFVQNVSFGSVVLNDDTVIDLVDNVRAFRIDDTKIVLFLNDKQYEIYPLHTVVSVYWQGGTII
jgi:hypothetical protein